MNIAPSEVPGILSRHLPAPTWDIVVDLTLSRGPWLIDERDGRRFLDLFTFFSSLPLGMNHPGLIDDPDFVRRLGRAAVQKTSNCDIGTTEYAAFVDVFSRVLGIAELPHLFFIDGGALAVENALKVAFDWKGRRSGGGRDINYRALHLTHAFHGRSGYTMSLTNTDPSKTALFPRWNWPRLPTPGVRFPIEHHLPQIVGAETRALAQARRELEQGDDIACFIAEPILCEGGDIHLRAEFLQAMQALCHEYDILFVLDEVQTGCGATGSVWAHQQLGLEPDLVAFGKRTQVCGVMGGRRVDLVPDNAFALPGRISSTWAGNLTDMVRATRILEIIEREGLIEASVDLGERLKKSLILLEGEFPGLVSNARGRGLLCAVDLPSRELRDQVAESLYARHNVLLLPCGERSLRFRPALTVTEEELDTGVRALARALRELSTSKLEHR
ncbi:L-lysine 6-transaminase [Nonomuraea sp. NPDC050663]|uniref:L-lysine 6-transaminase n=1 Tax=Nonomuraea sp. NPDC050663 TaxID=3364370 RepID=UPI0037AF475B